MPTTEAHPQTLLTVAEVAERLRVSPWSIYRRIGDGQLRALRVGQSGPFRVRTRDVEELLRPVEREGA